MSLTNELERLQALYDSGALTDAEFADAKAKVLVERHPQDAVQTRAVQADIGRLQIQNQILQLDQNWANERTRHMLYGRSGPAYVPTYSNTIGPTFLFAILSLVFFAFPGSAQHQYSEGVFMGLFILTIGIVMAVGGSIKVKAYNTAYEQYQMRRDELTNQLHALDQ